MSSNILSRFLPPTDSPSIYEAMRQHDAASDSSDIEERAGMAPGEDHFNDGELEEALADARDSGMSSPTAAAPKQPQQESQSSPLMSRRGKHYRPRWMTQASPRGYDLEEPDEDVPMSFRSRTPSPRPSPQRPLRWETPRDRHASVDNRHAMSRLLTRQHLSLANVDPKTKAMWRWANVEDLDNFLKDVYTYFLGNGFWSILLVRVLNLLTFGFVVGFSTFLTNCVDYHKVRGSKSLDEILVPKCTSNMSGTSLFLLWLFSFFWIGKLFEYLLDIRRLSHMHDFYYHLLGISDPEVQTISWQEVVRRLMLLRDSNPSTAAAVSSKHRRFLGSQSKQRMDAHDIANRLMRRENYMIALINKDILDLTLPIPFLRNRQLFSRTLEWNLNWCIMDYVFNQQGQLRTFFLKDVNRRALSEGLRRRFIFAGIMNIFVAPFIVIYFLMHYFFRYFNEFKKNPSEIGSRALASVLALASVIDPELFLGFEITPDRTVLFYLGVFGTVWAVSRGMAPEETDVFEPEYALRELIGFTHYFPASWNGRLHSDEVRKEFAVLYQMKVVIFLEEILSMIFTPFVLWFSLPRCSDRLIDFFREFTVHVDGVGYLCSFAVFDFKKGSNVMTPGQGAGKQDPRENYFSTKDGKMLASYYGFLDHYGTNNQQTSHRPFHPPPGLPTLGSPSLAGLPDRFDPQPSRPGTFGQSLAASKFRSMAAGENRSPAPSMLLDPHHQPSSSGFRPAGRTAPYARSRLARSQYPMDGHNEDDEFPSQTNPRGSGTRARGTATGGSSGGIGTDESNLGDSWRMNPIGKEDDAENGAGGENIDDIAGNAGVLGLIQQFQKANTDGRRPTVGI
ncbi:Autophagy-related protein 9 [Penicillium chermesinum]|nr:Autophagy-related protein 9 [Penicillium chermesinum]